MLISSWPCVGTKGPGGDEGREGWRKVLFLTSACVCTSSFFFFSSGFSFCCAREESTSCSPPAAPSSAAPVAGGSTTAVAAEAEGDVEAAASASIMPRVLPSSPWGASAMAALAPWDC